MNSLPAENFISKKLLKDHKFPVLLGRQTQEFLVIEGSRNSKDNRE